MRTGRIEVSFYLHKESRACILVEKAGVDMEIAQIFSVIEELNGQYCDLWEQVCNMESPTEYKQGVDAVGQVFIQMARQRRWAVEILDLPTAGNPICITMNPDSTERPLALSGHIDTVYPLSTFPVPAVRWEAGRIYGPGVIDCKGGVVAAVMAMDALMRCGFQKRPVKLIIQTDEETGSNTSNKQTLAFMLEKARDAIAFLNLEGVQYGTAVLSRKGILRYRFTVVGKSAHAAKCTVGANAICEAAYKIIQLEKWKDTEGITCNCGVIQGGTVPNSVAGECVFQADIRFVNEAQYREAVALCQRIAEESTVPGCTCRLEKVSERPAMPLTPENEALFAKMNSIYETCGLPVLRPRHCLGGSDAAYTTQAGIPTVDSLGVDGGNIHSPKEFAYIESLVDCAKRLAAMALHI